MMRLTFAGLAMATTLVFATDTPFEGVGQGFPPGPEGRLIGADATDMILKAKNTTQLAMAECEGEGRPNPCYLMEYGLLAKMNLFRHLTQGREKMDMGDLKRFEAASLEMNPECKAWDLQSHAKVIDLFDVDGDRYLDFLEWVALDWVLQVEQKGKVALINRFDENGCSVFNL